MNSLINRFFFASFWPIFTIIALLSVIGALSERPGSTGGADQLQASYARTAVRAKDAILNSVALVHPSQVVESVLDSDLASNFSIRAETLSEIEDEPQLSPEKRNQKIVQELSLAVLKSNWFTAIKDKEFEELKKSIDNTEFSERNVNIFLSSIAYIQLSLNSQVFDRINIAYGLFDIFNIFELIVNILVFLVMLSGATALFALKKNQFGTSIEKKKEAKHHFETVALFFAFGVALFSIWVPLRVYTEVEDLIVFPQDKNVPGPLWVIVFCSLVIALLAFAFLRDHVLSIIGIVVAVAASFAGSIFALQNLFVIRDVIGSGATFGTIAGWVLGGGTALAVISFLFWIQRIRED